MITMKKQFRLFLGILVLLFAADSAIAQSRIGYADVDAIAKLLPEFNGVKTQLDAYQKQFIDGFTAIQNQFTTNTTITGPLTEARRAELTKQVQDVQKQLQIYNDSVQLKIKLKTDELTQPLKSKVKEVVKTVALEKGYSYVINTGKADVLLFSDADDLTTTVKAKLDIK